MALLKASRPPTGFLSVPDARNDKKWNGEELADDIHVHKLVCMLDSRRPEVSRALSEFHSPSTTFHFGFL